MSEALAVAVHLGPVKEEKFVELIGRYAALWDALSERGARAVFTRKKDAYSPREEGQVLPVATTYYDVQKGDDGLYSAALRTGELVVGAALDTSGGFARYVDADRGLNPLELRNLCRSNLGTYRLFHDMQPPSFIVTNAAEQAELDEQLANMTSSKIVVKSNESRKGSGVRIVDRSLKAVLEVMDLRKLQDGKPHTGYLVQKHIECASTFEGLRDKMPDRGLLAANQEGIQLRQHMIDERSVLAIGRRLSDDEYISVEQDSVPQEVTDIGSEATRRLRAKTAATHSHVAADSIQDANTGQYYLLEVNGAWPAFVPGKDGREGDSRQLGEALATKLIAMAGA